MIEYNDCMLYLQDLIQFQHNDFGLTYGKIIQFFKLVSLLTYVQNPMLSLQEDVVEPQVTVECLLTLDQFVCVNQHVNILYCDPLAVVLAGTTSVPVSSICKVLPAANMPFSVILEYCQRSGILSRMTAEVFIYSFNQFI